MPIQKSFQKFLRPTLCRFDFEEMDVREDAPFFRLWSVSLPKTLLII